MLTGDNNVGNSTLLEALFVYVAEGNSDVLFRLAGERMNCFESRLEEDDEYTKKSLPLFYGLKLAYGNNILITSGTNKSLQIEFANYYEVEVQNEGGDTYFRRQLIRTEQELNDLSDIEKYEAIIVKYEGEEQLVPFNRARMKLRRRQSDINMCWFPPLAILFGRGECSFMGQYRIDRLGSRGYKCFEDQQKPISRVFWKNR